MIVIPPGKIIKPSNDITQFKLFIDSVKLNESIQQFVNHLDSSAVIKRNTYQILEAFKGKTVLSSEFANTLKLVDLLAADQNDLMTKLHGYSLGKTTLKTMPALIERVDRDIVLEALEIIKNPILGYILLILGFYSLIWGIFNKPKIFSISSATVLLTFAFYVFYTLPVNSNGIMLIVFAFIVLAVGVKVKSFGILQIAGAAVLFYGSIIMVDVSQTLGIFYIPVYLIIGTTLCTAIIFITARTV